MTATPTPARARRSPGKNVAVAVALSESATGKMQQRLCVDWPARQRFGSSARLQQFSWARGGRTRTISPVSPSSEAGSFGSGTNPSQ
jgi:hypothetical protein